MQKSWHCVQQQQLTVQACLFVHVNCSPCVLPEQSRDPIPYTVTLLCSNTSPSKPSFRWHYLPLCDFCFELSKWTFRWAGNTKMSWYIKWGVLWHFVIFIPLSKKKKKILCCLVTTQSILAQHWDNLGRINVVKMYFLKKFMTFQSIL
jgi:hypothetical protein